MLKRLIDKLNFWYYKYRYGLTTVDKIKLYLKKQGFTDEQIEKKIVIAQLRAHLEFFGYDTSDMTDEEIEEGVIEFGKVVVAVGITAEEAAEAFGEFGKQLNYAERELA